MSAERIWELVNADGSTRRVTLAQFRAELAERTVMTKPIAEAFRRGDLKACAAAQSAMRKKLRVS